MPSASTANPVQSNRMPPREASPGMKITSPVTAAMPTGRFT